MNMDPMMHFTLEPTEASNVTLFGEISMDACKAVYEFILAENDKPMPPENILIHLSSTGGDADAARMLCSAISRSMVPVHIFGSGALYSAAVDILVCGHYRTIDSMAIIMTHDWFQQWGERTGVEIKGLMKYVDLYSKISIKHMARHTKLNEKEVKSKLFTQNSNWWTAMDALQMGMCDEICDHNAEIIIP